MAFNNLPGIQVTTVDRGMATRKTPNGKSILIVGTSGRGDSGRTFQVVDRGLAAQTFGLGGTLVKAMEECMVFGDNVTLYRMGTVPGELTGIGADGTSTGYDISLGQAQADANSIYSIWYSKGVLYLFLNGNLVYANDTANGVVVDLGDSIVSGSATAGLPLMKTYAGTGTIESTGTAVTGTGTHFQTANKIGDLLVVDAEVKRIATITSDTALTVDSAFAADLAAPTVFKYAKVGEIKSAAGALSLSQAAALTAVGSNTIPVYVAPNDGLSMTARQTYVALAQALELLNNFSIQQVYCPNVVLDNPNVGYYVSTDATTVENNPATNPNALDWLGVVVDEFGNSTYHWASETTDSAGNAVAAATFVSAADRLNQDYHEVSFGHLLAKFASDQSAEEGGCIAFIGCRGPVTNKFDLPSTRAWIGYLPVVSPSDGVTVTRPGKGLCGIPYLVGTTSAKLNSLTADSANGWRQGGFYVTTSGFYDGGAVLDINQNPQDMGANLHVVGDFGYMQNGWGAYIANGAGLACGQVSMLDEKVGLTNQTALGIRQMYRASLGQLDSLTKAKVNMLRFIQDGQPATWLHDRTAANEQSDYIFMVRTRVKNLVCATLYQVGFKFIGSTSTDGMEMNAFKTALDSKCGGLQKLGYVASCSTVITSTAQQRRLGQITLQITFIPPDELVQIIASIGIGQSPSTTTGTVGF
jgi:hypothetical protein